MKKACLLVRWSRMEHVILHNQKKARRWHCLLAPGTLMPDGTSNPTQSEKSKKGGENGIGTKPRTGAIVCPKLVLRDRIKNEMWYRHSLTDQPMIDKLTKWGVFKSTYASITGRNKLKTLKDKAVSEGEFASGQGSLVVCSRWGSWRSRNVTIKF